MKKTVLAVLLTSVFSSAAIAESASVQGWGDGAKLSLSYNAVATQLKEIDPVVGNKFEKYVTGGADTRDERRQMAYEFVTEVAQSDSAAEIESALRDVYVKHDGNALYADKALNAADSILVDAVAHAKANPEAMQKWKDAGVTDEQIREASKRYDKENWTDINKAIEANRKALDELKELEKENWKPNNDVIIDERSSSVEVEYVEVMDIETAKGKAGEVAEDLEKNGVTVDDEGRIMKDGDQVGQVHVSESESLDGENNSKVEVEVFGKNGKNQAYSVDVDKNGKVTYKEGTATVTTPDTPDLPDPELGELYKSAVAANTWATNAERQFKQEVARLDSKIDTVEGKVSNGAAMVGAMSQMQFGADGLGVGAGVSSFNGSKALAIGVGYAFGDKNEWMAKGSFGYAESSKGKGSKDTMAAAGLTYSFK